MANSYLNYIPCTLAKTGDYFYFYALTPSGELERKRKYVTRFKSKDKKRVIKLMMKNVDAKLASGWSPFMEQSARSFATLITEAINRFISEKSRETRHHSQRSFKSIMNYWKQHVETHDPSMMCLQLDSAYAKWLMRHVWNTKQIEARTFNNYLTWYRMFCSWCISSGYMSANPFLEVDKKRAGKKTRKLIPEIVLIRIREYFYDHNKGMDLIIQLMIYTGLRPNEILQLKKTDFNLHTNSVFISIEVSKSARASKRTIPKNMINPIKLWLEKCGEADYLFSTGMRPGPRQKESRDTGKIWSSMRKHLNIPVEYKLYSCRDNGVVMMLNSGVPPHVVMEQFGHSDLKFTTIYAKHLKHTAHPDILSLQ